MDLVTKRISCSQLCTRSNSFQSFDPEKYVTFDQVLSYLNRAVSVLVWKLTAKLSASVAGC